MNDKSLVIIDNEKIFKQNENYYCDNIDCKSIPEGLSNRGKTLVIARKSKTKRVQKINLSNIKTGSNIITFINLVMGTFKLKDTNYLLISITPYTFFAFIILSLFRKKIFLYIRSDGYEEYKCKLGFFGSMIYHFMFVLVTSNSNLIVCRKELARGKKYNLALPSQLDDEWTQNQKKVILDKVKLLYVGRIRVEKGIFSFLKMFEKIDLDVEFSIVSDIINIKKTNKNVNFLGFGYDAKSLIKIYDDHNIMILPSFTEGHPQVVIESLSRKRPVIVFEEISHVTNNKKGIFVAKRNVDSFTTTVKYIMQNYYEIQKEIDQNNLPTKEKFINQISNIVRERKYT